MKKLILESIEDVLTDEQKKWVDETRRSGKTIPDAWFDEHEVIVTRAYNGDLFKSIKSREELYKFLRNCCNIEYIDKILEIPESLEALNIDERFIFCFNERVDFEISVGTDLFPGITCLYTEEERKDILENGIELRREYFNSTSTMEEYKEELKKLEELRKAKYKI